MRDWSTRGAVCLAVFGWVVGCGATDSAEPGGAQGAAATEGPAPAPLAPPSPAPVVRLAWVADGRLSLENIGDVAVSVERAIGLPADSPMGPLSLAVTCEPAARAERCITLVSGAAVAFGRWPDAYGACRCPPCAPALAAHDELSLVIRSCDGQHTLPQALPPR